MHHPRTLRSPLLLSSSPHPAVFAGCQIRGHANAAEREAWSPGLLTWAGLSPLILALHHLARRPNRSLKLRPNGRPPGPGCSALASSAPRAWRPTVGPSLALTLGRTRTTVQWPSAEVSASFLLFNLKGDRNGDRTNSLANQDDSRRLGSVLRPLGKEGED